MDISTLLSAIDVLARPQQHAVEVTTQAQTYCDNFKNENSKHLPQFFQLFDQLDEKTQTQHKFWILGAIGDVLASAIRARLAGESIDIDVLQTGHAMLFLIQ